MYLSGLGLLLLALSCGRTEAEDPYETYLEALQKRHAEYHQQKVGEPQWSRHDALQTQFGVRDGDEADQFPESYWRELVKQMDEVNDGQQQQPMHMEPDQMNFNNGEHKVSGGAGEGQQQLGPMGEFANTKESKSDRLPSYCHPPNPCPKGFAPDLFDSPCEARVEDTREYNQGYIWSKMAAGECQCDTEHMHKCPTPMVSETDEERASPKKGAQNPYLVGDKRSLVAKKSPQKRDAKFSLDVKPVANPWLSGEALNNVQKKGDPMIQLHRVPNPM